MVLDNDDEQQQQQQEQQEEDTWDKRVQSPLMVKVMNDLRRLTSAPLSTSNGGNSSASSAAGPEVAANEAETTKKDDRKQDLDEWDMCDEEHEDHDARRKHDIKDASAPVASNAKLGPGAGAGVGAGVGAGAMSVGAPAIVAALAPLAARAMHLAASKKRGNIGNTTSTKERNERFDSKPLSPLTSPLESSVSSSKLDFEEAQLQQPSEGSMSQTNTDIGLSAHTVGPITVYIEKVLGQGGHGIVCKGKFGRRQVAVKRVPSFLTNDDREAELHMKCDSHENVLRIQHMEKDKVTGWSYFVLELCQGTLKDFVAGTLVVNEKRPKDLLNDAAKGVVHLHKLGIVHRDIKPSNILISRPESGIVKAVIGDFGVSKKLEDGHQSFSASMAGTQGWMAPEIMFGDSRSRATILVDVYALGLVFFYVLTEGNLPFAGKSHFELMRNVKNGEKNLGQLLNNETAKFLIESMTSLDAKHRPPMEAVLKHPFFWDNNKELNFIELMSDNLQGVPRVRTNLKRSKKAILGSSIADWGEIASTSWPEFAPVINHLRNPKKNVAKYDFTLVPALLRAVRNLSHHLTEQPTEIQGVFGGSAPKTLVSDLFLKIFPQLLVGTWSLAGKDIGHEPGFKEFYHEWWMNKPTKIPKAPKIP